MVTDTGTKLQMMRVTPTPNWRYSLAWRDGWLGKGCVIVKSICKNVQYFFSLQVSGEDSNTVDSTITPTRNRYNDSWKCYNNSLPSDDRSTSQQYSYPPPLFERGLLTCKSWIAPEIFTRAVAKRVSRYHDNHEERLHQRIRRPPSFCRNPNWLKHIHR